MNTISDFFDDRTILITGASGFLGQPMLEKILREIPQVRRIYLLLRPKRQTDGSLWDAQERVRREVLSSSVFERLRGEFGDGFEEYFNQKVYGVGGDLTSDRLGIDDEVYATLTEEVDIVINSAAVVTFDERLDFAVNLNMMGPRRIMAFANDCRALACIHVSTAYVHGMCSGRMEETLVPLKRLVGERANDGETLSLLLEKADELTARAGTRREYADGPEMKRAFLKEAKKELASRGDSEDGLPALIELCRTRWIRESLMEEGIDSAREAGWNDTYTYTKALGEHMVAATHDQVPTAIVRPAIIESSLAEPVPGWLDGFRMADPLIAAMAKAQLKDFPASPGRNLDLIPVDLVVNTILAAIPATAESNDFKIYQVASSSENPATISTIVGQVQRHFFDYPLRDKRGEPIVVPAWQYPTVEQFGRRQWLQVKVPLMIAKLVFSIIPKARKWRRRIDVLLKALQQLDYYLKIYGPYTNLDCQFDTTNTRLLYESLAAPEQTAFSFCPTRIDWPEYIYAIHIPGLKYYVMKIVDESTERLRHAAVHGMDSDPRGPYLPTTIPELLTRSAARWPDKVAVQAKRGGQWTRLTYADIHERSRLIAASFRKRGLSQGDRVVLYSENQPEWAVAYFAASALGLTVVPLDRQVEPEDACDLARLTDAKAILASHCCMGSVASVSTDTPVWNINNWCLPLDSPDASEVEFTTPSDDDLPHVHPESPASIVFLIAVVEPKAAVLSHRNFLADLKAVTKKLTPNHDEQFLSVLPLNHVFEFTTGLLTPVSAGATVTYVDRLNSREIMSLMRETGTTAVLGVPRLFRMFLDGIQKQVQRRSAVVRAVFKTALWYNRRRQSARFGVKLFKHVHEAFGGKLRIFISGGAALDSYLYQAFWSMGIPLCEGYGLTETAPVLTVCTWSEHKPGSAGKPLPGVDLRIEQPNGSGVGEIIVRAPNVMLCYYDDPEATETAFKDGWFHTGDLGRLDDEGFIHITGRIKEVMITGAGKNVYPVEVEHKYGGFPAVDNYCIVGVPPPGKLSDEVHAVMVPDRALGRDEGEVRAQVVEAAKERGRSLPSYQRIQKFHFSESLPLKADGKVDRKAVRASLVAEASYTGDAGEFTPVESSQTIATSSPAPDNETSDALPTVVAALSELTRCDSESVRLEQDLEIDLGVDSMMRLELVAHLESGSGSSLPPDDAVAWQSVSDVVDSLKRSTPKTEAEQQPQESNGRSDDLKWYTHKGLPIIVPTLRHAAHTTGRLIYSKWFGLDVSGLELLPEDQSFIIAPNHSSHLDTGAITFAVRGASSSLYVLGAKDYFFNSWLKGWFVNRFLSVLPIDRGGDFLEGIQLCRRVAGDGHPLLVFPEGTRSPTGRIRAFRVGLGLLAAELDVPVVPAWIDGTYDALPKGCSWPRRSSIHVSFGAPISMSGYGLDQLDETQRFDAYRRITSDTQAAVEALAHSS